MRVARRLAGASGASRERLETTNRARIGARLSGPRKLCKGTAASPGDDDSQLESSRPLHLPWPSPAQVPPSLITTGSPW